MQGTSEIGTSPDPLARSLRGEAGHALVSRLEGPPGLAAFDADGTLWDGDLGEAVLLDLIAARRLRDPPRDPWAEYLALFERGPAEAFAYALIDERRGEKAVTEYELILRKCGFNQALHMLPARRLE